MAVARICARPFLKTGGVLLVVGRGFALDQVTLQVPSPELADDDGVVQLPPICPPFVTNATEVPSGAGLLYRSASCTVNGTVMRSMP